MRNQDKSFIAIDLDSLNLHTWYIGMSNDYKNYKKN